MKKSTIKKLIVFSSVFFVFLCGTIVLLFSLNSYRNSVHDTYYEKVNAAYEHANTYLSELKDIQLLLVPRILESEGFIDFLKEFDEYELKSTVNSLILPNHLDYGVITDTSGNVIIRINEKGSTTNHSNFPHIIRALSGDITHSIAVGDNEPLRSVTSAPIIDYNGNIIGTITIGNTLDRRELAKIIGEMIDCEFTLFVDMTPVASSLVLPDLDEITEEDYEKIVEDVLGNGQHFNGTLQFFEDEFFSALYPIKSINNSVLGMMFIGKSTSDANTDVLVFFIAGGIIVLAFTVLIFIISTIIAGIVIKRIEAIEEHMQNRDMLFESVNKASFILLEIDETDDIRMPLVSSMEYLGLAFAIDHVHLWRYRVLDDNSNQFVREYSWVSEYAKLKAGTPKYINSSGDGVLDNWMEKFLENDIVRGIVSEMEPSHQKVINTLNAKSIAMMPIYLDEQFWGMFTVDNMQTPKHYSDDEIYILRSISLMMANIVRRHDLQKENLKVYYDALTGINNRRFFDKTMARTISSLSRSGNDLGLMMIDVDYFKKYNDTYGHGAGDECLIRVAEILSQCANRVDDFVARYGGEEFVAVMPNTDREGAEQVAKRMLERIRAAKIPHEASDVAECVTVSIGITTGKVTHRHTPEMFLQRADDMLYKSKHDGRNRATYGELEEVKT